MTTETAFDLSEEIAANDRELTKHADTSAQYRYHLLRKEILEARAQVAQYKFEVGKLNYQVQLLTETVLLMRQEQKLGVHPDRQAQARVQVASGDTGALAVCVSAIKDIPHT